MAEAIVGPLVGKLQELALSEAKALVAVNGDIRSLRERLMWMQAFLRHADPKRRDSSNQLIRVWIKQTRDAAFDAEDAIDHYYLKVDLSRYPGWTQSIIRFLAGFTTQVSIRHDLSRRIAEINLRLEDIINNKEKYKIEDAANNSAVVEWKPSNNISTATINLDDVHTPLIKLKELEDKIDKAIQDTQKKRVVICVTGESGVGKTTLVREVYDKSITKAKFHKRIWATFPPYLSSSNIFQLIHQKLQGRETWSKKKKVEQEVQGVLKKENYFLVIDGEVSKSDWNALVAALPEGKEKGVIIRIMHGNPSKGSMSKYIELSHFEKSITTELFKKLVHTGEKAEDQLLTTKVPWNSRKIDEMVIENIVDSEETNEKICFADVIHYITKGLPLAIILLSGLVKTKEYPNEWKVVFKHLVSKQSKRLESILTMCFDDLPHEIKSCFLYFAALPSNTPIETRKLVCMWMAEGFLTPKDGKTMEKVGRIYLKELIVRNLVQLVKNDDSNDDNEYVTIHHKVHEFLQMEAQETNFVDIHNGDDNHSLSTARRLSLQNYKDKYAALKNSLPKLRSILSNFQEEDENGNEDYYDESGGEDEDESEGEDKEKSEGEDKEDGLLADDQVGRGAQQEDEEEGKEGSDENGEVEGNKYGGDEVGEDESRENIEDQENETNFSNGEENNNEEALENENNEQENNEKLGTMPRSGLLGCWGKGENLLDRNKSYIRKMLQNSKFLRVINLQGVDIGDKLPEAIGNVAHLQYLGITACSLKHIPSTIGKLMNLQTLDVRNTYVEELPIEFWKIKKLRHVFGECLFFPKRVGELKHLQTLQRIRPDENNGWDNKTFEKMERLQTLKIWDFSHNADNAKAVSDLIEGSNVLQYLETLELYFKYNILPVKVFTSNSQRSLRSLTLDATLDEIPTDFKFSAPNLTFFSLENTNVSQDFVDRLGNLPLTNLILGINSYKDGQLVFSPSGFGSLKKLTLSNLDLKLLKIKKNALPELKDLVVDLWDLEEFTIEVSGEHNFVNKIEVEDEGLFKRIIQAPTTSKKVSQVLASGGT